MDNKSSMRFWFLWVSVFSTGLILLVTGIFYMNGVLRIVLICSTVIWFVLGILLVMGKSTKPNKIKKHPLITRDAKVIAKTSEIDAIITASLFYVSFGFSDGTRENIQVNVNQYNIVVEGETGTLTYEKHEHYLKFIDFKPNE